MYVDLNQFRGKNSTGFGLAAYQRAKAAGLSDAQISNAVSTQGGLTIGSQAGSALGADTRLYKYQNQGGFGANALAAARGSGLTDAQIRSSLASSGLQIGDRAAQSLNVNPGYTFAGLSPFVKAGFKGNSGTFYPSRPQLAPRGMPAPQGATFSADRGFSPTFYISGGTDDFFAPNYIFGTEYDGSTIGGGYSDPEFHIREGVDPAFKITGGGFGIQSAPAAPAPPASYSSAGMTGNTATGVRISRTPGSGTTYSSLNRAGSSGLRIGGLNV